tara:strand:+ start:2647 stop:4041 length:1395 start_codon:yes stop_codon:yes gene_type:complete
LGKKVPLKELSKILCNYNPQKFKLKEKPYAFQVIASTFKDLKCLANLCLEAFGQRPFIVEPERQFLIERDWNYFDAFQFFHDKPVKSNAISFPDIKTEFSSDPLPLTFKHLLEHDATQATAFVKAMALSRILKIPIDSLPDNSFLEIETILENMFFKNGFPTEAHEFRIIQSIEKKYPISPGAVEMDFSELWPILITQPFYNLGVDSIDCDCCKPGTVFDRNILPNSSVNGIFLAEAVYFESIVKSYAEQFHTSQPLKENRDKLTREFCLNYTPVGPFRRGQEAELLLCDALQLCTNDKVKIMNESKLHWFCLKKESFISKELRRMNNSIVSLSERLLTIEKEALQEHMLFAQGKLSNDLDFVFNKAFIQALKLSYKGLPLHLTNQRSSFFQRRLAHSVETIQALTLHRFKTLVKENNGKLIRAEQASALVKTDQPMSLAKEFSKREKIPLVIAPAKKTCLGTH